MSKNMISEIARLLGVEIGEKFIIQNADRKETVILAMDGLRIPFPHGMAEMDDGRLLLEVLQGRYEIIKLPWNPEYGDGIYFPSVNTKGVLYSTWYGATLDYALKALGMVYRTYEEAEKNFAEDFKKLTGKE